MRALLTAVIVMGVLIVVGTGTLVFLVVQRLSGAHGPVTAIEAVLHEPAGTHIAEMTSMGDRLALRLQGGGPDRVLLLDPHAGTVLGRVTLSAP